MMSVYIRLRRDSWHFSNVSSLLEDYYCSGAISIPGLKLAGEVRNNKLIERGAGKMFALFLLGQEQMLG